MSHRPMVHSERRLRPDTLDRKHQAEHDAVSRPKPLKASELHRLDHLAVKKEK